MAEVRGRGFGAKRQMDSYDGYSGGGGYAKKRKIMDDVYRFIVRQDLVKALIGKGGEHIKVIKDEAEAQGIETKVSVYAQGANGTHLMEGSQDRVMSVQTSIEGLTLALNHLVPAMQTHKPRGGGDKPTQKLELRLIVPSHCCSGIIGTGGSVVKKLKEETSSYIQVYTFPLPESEEYCVRIQNFESDALINTAVKIFESIADIKGKNPITMYDPIWFERGAYGDTGSYIDTAWYQEAIRAGAVQHTSYKEVQNLRKQHNNRPAFAPDMYDYGPYGYDEYGYAGYEGYDDPYYYSYDYAPMPRGRGRGGPRGRPFSGSRSRGRGGPRGRGRGGSAPPSTKAEAMEVTESETDLKKEVEESVE